MSQDLNIKPHTQYFTKNDCKKLNYVCTHTCKLFDHIYFEISIPFHVLYIRIGHVYWNELVYYGLWGTPGYTYMCNVHVHILYICIHI